MKRKYVQYGPERQRTMVNLPVMSRVVKSLGTDILSDIRKEQVSLRSQYLLVV